MCKLRSRPCVANPIVIAPDDAEDRLLAKPRSSVNLTGCTWNVRSLWANDDPASAKMATELFNAHDIVALVETHATLVRIAASADCFPETHEVSHTHT